MTELPADPVIGLPVKKSTLNPWLVVLLLCFIGALNYLDRTMITTMNASITQTMPMTKGQFGLLTSVFLWTYAAFSPFAGFLADRFRRSQVIVASLLVWSLVTWLTGFVQTFEQLLATRAMMGISEACYYPAALAMISDYHQGKTRSLATGVHEVGVTLGASLGFLGGMIGEKYHWSVAFSLFGWIGIGYAVLLFFVLKDHRPECTTIETRNQATRPALAEGLRHLFGQRSFLQLIAFWGLLGIVGWMILGWLPVFYREKFQLSQSVAGLYATGYLYPASMAGVLVGGFLADRWSLRNVRARILVPALGLAVAAPGIFIAGYSTILPVTVAFFMVYAFTRAFTDANLMPVLCLIAAPQYRATGYGVLNMFACLVGGLGLYAGGVLQDSTINLSIIFQVASLLVLVCAGLLWTIRPKKN